MRTCAILAFVAVLLAGLAAAQEQEIVFKNYNLKHLKLSDPEARQKVEAGLSKVVSKSGRWHLDERSNSVFVRDTQAKQNEVATLIAKLDVKSKEETTATTVTRRLAGVKASVAKMELEAAAAKDKELAGLKMSHSDQTSTLVLTGTPAQLEKARIIVDALEEKFGAEVETSVYKIKNRSAAGLAEIVKLHLVAAPGTGVAVDDVTNSLIVRETKKNHDIVRKVIDEFDTQLATVVLDFRIIYASDKGNEVDESIKDVAEELKKTTGFTSYKALEAPIVKVEQGHGAGVEDTATRTKVSVKRCLYDAKAKKVKLEGLEVSRLVDRAGKGNSVFTIRTTISADAGHLTVIGGTDRKDAKDALVVAVKATIEK